MRAGPPGGLPVVGVSGTLRRRPRAAIGPPAGRGGVPEWSNGAVSKTGLFSHIYSLSLPNQLILFDINRPTVFVCPTPSRLLPPRWVANRVAIPMIIQTSFVSVGCAVEYSYHRSNPPPAQTPH